MGTKATTGAVLLSFVAAAAATACGGTDDQPPAQAPAPTVTAPAPLPPDTPAIDAAAPPPKPSMAEMLRAAEKGMLTALNDPAKMVALYAPDAVMWTPGTPEVRGRDAIEKATREFNSLFANLATADQRIWTKGNTLVIQFVTTGTDKTSSKPCGGTGLDLLTLNDDGLIVMDRTYYDVETYLRQTGAYKTKDGVPAVPSLPTGEPERHDAKNDATEAANAASEAAANAAWFKKDDKAYFGYLSDDVAAWDFSRNDPTKSSDKKHIEAIIAGLRKTFDVTAWKETNVMAVEDFTITEGEANLTQKSGKKKSATLHNVEIDQWKDGKIVKAWQWSNNLEMDTQLETGPAAPTAAKGATKGTKPAASTSNP